ncbi:MAG: hypothetical protein E7054_03240 [Lentisphaerae bacterium]|nr:hypothetical protein [Lentisphaerota bacterium]
MNKMNFSLLLAGSIIVPFICGGNAAELRAGQVVVTPQAIPGGVKSNSHSATGGYAPSSVQAELKINVSDATKVVNVIRDNTDPMVITKPYSLKNADPYAVRSYLEAAVGAKSINSSPAQVTAVKFSDGTGVVLVSAEAYRFADSEDGKGIDGIVASLDRPGLNYLPNADAYIYFPRISRAANLRDMLLNVGSSALDPQFEVAPGTITVDAELNALVIKASKWNWADMRAMLKQYDRPIPEFKVTYRVLEIFAENDDRIGVDFQSWKNNEGVDLFSAGMVNRRNWGTFFSSAIEDSGSSRTSYWNFNPKWNTRYLDFMTSIGKAKCLAQGEITVQNRQSSAIQVASGFFYDRTYYTAGAKTIAEGTGEYAFLDINPDTILRESTSKIVPLSKLNESLADAGVDSYLAKAGYTMRVMGTQVGTATYYDAIAKKNYQTLLAAGLPVAANGVPVSNLLAQIEEKKAAALSAGTAAAAAMAKAQAAYAQGDAASYAAYAQQARALKAESDGYVAEATALGEQAKNYSMKSLEPEQAAILANTTTSPLTKYLTGYVDAAGNRYSGNYYREDYGYVDAAPGIIHGWLQYPMVANGFQFNLKVSPVITGKAATMKFEMNGNSLLGWNSDGSARRSKSEIATTVQLPYSGHEFVLGGVRKSESVRSNTGLPFFKDLPVIGRIFSTESESIKQSQLVVLAKVEYVNPDSFAGAEIRENLGKIVKGVNKGMNSRVGNMFFGQYGLDSDLPERNKRLNDVGEKINDEYKTIK